MISKLSQDSNKKLSLYPLHSRNMTGKKERKKKKRKKKKKKESRGNIRTLMLVQSYVCTIHSDYIHTCPLYILVLLKTAQPEIALQIATITSYHTSAFPPDSGWPKDSISSTAKLNLVCVCVWCKAENKTPAEGGHYIRIVLLYGYVEL